MRRTMQMMGSHSAARLVCVGVALLVVGGCATKRDMKDLQVELRALALQQDSLISGLRQEARLTQDTLRTQSSQIFDFRGDISQQLRRIVESLATLQEMVGQNQRGIAATRDEMSNLRRLSLPGGGRGAVDSTFSGGAAPTVVGTGDAETIYNAAIEQFNRGSLSTARQAFQQFLDAYPNHALAPDAHFYLADILVQEDRLDDALDAFREIGELFPTADKVPDALYRMALIHIDQGDTAEARTVLERIVNTYPESGVALLARDKLAKIR